MFQIQNGKIKGSKTLDIGKTRIVNLVFKTDLTFADDDVFVLNLGDISSSNYAFVDDGCVRFSYVNVGSLITSSSNDLSITITKNGETILTDTITLEATVQGGGSVVEDDTTAVVTERVVDSFYNINFEQPITLLSVQNTELLILGSIPQGQDKVYTVQIWVKPYVDQISTLTFSQDIVLTGDIPDSLAFDGSIYVFVARCYKDQSSVNNIVMNYAYSFMKQ